MALAPDPSATPADTAPPGLPAPADQSRTEWALLVGAVYGVLAWYAILLSRQPGSVATLWFANAAAIAMFQVRPGRDAPLLLAGVALGNALANLAAGDAPGTALQFIPANLIEVALGAWLLRLRGDPAHALSHPAALLQTILLGGVVPALVGSAVGAAMLAALAGASFSAVWTAWFAGGVVGNVSVLPFGLLLLARGWRVAAADLRRPESLAVVLMAVVVALLAPRLLTSPQVYLSVALVAAAAVGRFAGASLAVLLSSFAVTTLIATGNDLPPGSQRPDLWSDLYLPLVLALVPPLFLAATLERIGQQVRELGRREADFRNVYRKTPVMMHSVDIDRRLLSVNDEWLARLGYEREEVIGRRSTEFLTPESRRLAEEVIIPSFLSQRVLRDVEYQMVARGGEILDVRLSAIWETDADDRPVRTLAVIQDITEQKRLAAELAAEKERIEVTLHSIGDGVVTTDDQGRITYLNPVAEQLVGWRLAEARGRAFSEVVHLTDQATGAPLLSPIERCGPESARVGIHEGAVLRDRRGQEYGVRDSVAPIRGRDGALLGAIMVFQDVTEARALAQKLAYLAHHDSLTDLPNRVLFQDRVLQACQQAQRQGGRFAVVFMDLDHFKHVNDSLGHAVGDDLLQTIARRLTAQLRASDTVCRLGGDEFVMLLRDVSGPDDVAEVAKKILREVALPSMLKGTEVSVGISLGIAIHPEDGEDPETLMKHADAAMYRSKREGRNRFQFFSKTVDEAASARLRLEADMRRGLAEGQFVAYFQPIIDAASREPVALEALARWHRPDGRFLGPDVFIPIAEESSLILQLGASMLRQSCEQLQAWRGTPLSHLTMAFNVSTVQLADPGFVDTVAAILQSTGVAGTQLAMEITESTLMRDPDATLQVLRQIKALGIRIAVDDFGTGYSSLSHLKRFPVDSVKIDRSFVRDLETDPDDRELIKAIIAMSRSLRLRVVAEGVETEAQATILASMECTGLQGYLYARPVAAAAATAWLHERIRPSTALAPAWPLA